MQIHAVTDNTKIEAAISAISRPTRRLMASADLALVGRLTIAEIDAKLAAAPRLTVHDRLAIKVELSRLNLIAD